MSLGGQIWAAFASPRKALQAALETTRAGALGVLAASADQRFLRYDKDIRWSEHEAERVLVEGIVHQPGETLIPSFLRRGYGTVKVHIYGTKQPTASSAAQNSLRN